MPRGGQDGANQGGGAHGGGAQDGAQPPQNPPAPRQFAYGEDYVALAHSCRSLRGSFTRRINEANDCISSVDDEQGAPRAIFIASMREHKLAMLGAFRAAEEQYLRLLAATDPNDDARVATIEGRLANMSNDKMLVTGNLDRRIAAGEEALEAQRNQPQGPAPPAGGAQGGGARPKTVEALKPPTLSKAATPTEVTAFCLRFRSYYLASQFRMASPEEQQAYFLACIDENLFASMTKRLVQRPGTLACSDDPEEITCLTILREECLARHPLPERRLTFFRSAQTSGQDFISWATDLEALADEAEMHNITRDGIMVMRLLTGTCDDRLREKLLEVQEPTQHKLLVAAQLHLASRINLKTMNNETPRANNTSSGGNQTNKKNNNNKRAIDPEKKRIQDGINALKNQGRCLRCGSQMTEGHLPCPAADETCHNCGKKGHLAKVCQTKPKSQAAPKANQAQAQGGQDAQQ